MRVFLFNEINKYDSYGINLLSAILKKEGHESRVFLVPDLIENTTITMNWLKVFKPAFHVSDEDYIDYVLSFNPQVVGFSIVTSYWNRSSKLAQIVKRKKPEVITIAGGPHTSVSLQKEMFEESGFDYIVKGDGEIALPQLIDALESKNYEPEIPGVYFLRHEEMRGAGMGELIKLDEMPFQDKSDVFRDYPYMQRLYVVNSQRSCQFSCTYCGSPAYRNAYHEEDETIFRRRSVDNLIQELHDAKKMNPKMQSVGFFDDTFTSGKQWIRDFAREYKKYINLPYFMCTNPCLLQSEELVYMLKESGLAFVEIGVQAIDEDFRIKSVKRPDSDKQISKTADLLRKYKIYFQANHIFGLDLKDFHDEEFLKKTIEYYIKLHPNRTHCFELEFLPACEETDKALNENRITQEQHDRIHRGDSSASYNFGGSLEEIEGLKTKEKLFIPYIVLLEMMPFLPHSLIKKALNNNFIFKLVRMVPFNYIILARLMNTIKDSRDIQASPHYRKYWDGAFHVLFIKKYLRLFRSGKVLNGINGSPPPGLIEGDPHLRNSHLVARGNR